MTKNKFLTVSALVSTLLSSPAVFAWADMGHETVAMVAQKYLTPEAKQGILNILGPEDLALAAKWPDAVRDDRDFDAFKDYHFVEVPTGQDYQNIPPSERASKDAYTIIHNYPALLKDKNKSRSEKIVALRYLVHVIGDVHQPLHVGNGLDMGGNLCEVMMDSNQKQPTNLHAAWDSKLVDLSVKALADTHNPAIKYYSYVNYAEDLLRKNPVTPEQIKKIQAADYFQWFKESADYRPQVYPDNGANEKNRAYCKSMNRKEIIDRATSQLKTISQVENGYFDSNRIPVLSDDYKKTAVTIIESQIIKGGLRLAAILNNTFTEKSSGPSKAEILKVLQLVNPKK